MTIYRRLLQCCLAGFALLIVPFSFRETRLVGQEPVTASPATTAAPEATSGPAASIDPRLLDELRRLAGGTAEQRSLAIREAIRQRLWTELDLYVANARLEELSDAERVIFAESIGTLLMSRAIEASQPNAVTRQTLDGLLQQLRAAVTSEETLQEAIKGLGSSDRDELLRSSRKLLRGGYTSIALLTKASAAVQPDAPRAKLVEVLSSFGQPARDAVRQMGLYGETSLRPGALSTLWLMERDAALPALAVALVSPWATLEEQKLAQRLFDEDSLPAPSASEVESYLFQKLEAAEGNYQATMGDTTGEVVWQLDEASQNVQPVVVTRSIYQARLGADIAELMRRLGALRRDRLQRALGADLRYRFLADAELGTAESVAAVKETWGEAAEDVPLLNGILAESRTQPMRATRRPGDLAKALGAVRLLGAIGGNQLLVAENAKPAALVQATSDPNARLRYEAANAIAEISEVQNYLGSVRVLERWLEMSHLGGGPRALLLINQADVATPVNQWLSEHGFEVTQVGSVREMLSEVDRGGDIQLIVATTRPPDYPALEMVDRVRARALGGDLPMLLLGPSMAGFEQIGQRWVSPTYHFDPLPSDPELPVQVSTIHAGLTNQWNRVLANETAPLSPGERSAFAQMGIRALSSIAEDRRAELVYPWRRHEGEIIDACRLSGFSEASFRVLSALGTRNSQDLLLSLATNASVSQEVQQRAVDAFAASVGRFGSLLQRQQVAMLYDRYNASSQAASRQIVGKLLDVLEERAGVTSKDKNGNSIPAAQ